jgi:hypothetical protein
VPGVQRGATGIDVIPVGALTHSAPDTGMDRKMGRGNAARPLFLAAHSHHVIATRLPADALIA